MSKWDLYVRSPRWLEVSGLPQQLCREHGPAAWVVFKKICEIECEANLSPDWFSVRLDDLCAWTGLKKKELRQIVTQLQEDDLVDDQELEDGWRLRVRTPLAVPEPEAKIRERLRAMGIESTNVRLRYLENDTSADRFAKVLELYQSVFGARMTSQIADELREVAEIFEWPAIEEAFEEAREQKKTNFHWVLNRLYKEIYDEQVAENLRDASRSSLPSGYELT
jgi:poly-D-alanine transfer protein DltD